MTRVTEGFNFASWITQHFPVHQESVEHPHAEIEKAELFSCINGMSAELETLNLLNALVYATKPRLALETGTGYGYASMAIAAALWQNGTGVLHSVELDVETLASAKNHFILCQAWEKLITFHQADSLAFIGAWPGDPFDLVFFDSLIQLRHHEFEALMKRGLLAPRALCIFHDTSRHRGESFEDSCPEMIETLDRHSANREWLEFDLSRGLRIIRLP